MNASASIGAAFLAITLPLDLLAQSDPSTTTSASISVERRSCSCSLTAELPLAFGTWSAPIEDVGHIDVSLQGSRTSVGVLSLDLKTSSLDEEFYAGRAELNAEDCDEATTTIEYPSSLSSADGTEKSLTFSHGRWGWSTTAGNYLQISSNSHTERDIGGEGASLKRFFAVGGRAGGINANSAVGDYSGRIILSTTCN